MNFWVSQRGRQETQKEPFTGDAVNSYNDGPQADGSQLGPFYELESSSPVRELRKGETLVHRHVTLHVEGDEEELNLLAKNRLGVGLRELKRMTIDESPLSTVQLP